LQYLKWLTNSNIDSITHKNETTWAIYNIDISLLDNEISLFRFELENKSILKKLIISRERIN